MDLADWIREHVTTDERALSWFTDGEAEQRIVHAYREMLAGYEVDTSAVLKTTHLLEQPYDGVVDVGEIDFTAICPHHFLPFSGTMRIRYVPGRRILGLGKFPRLVDALSRRFQLQELLVQQVAAEIVASGDARAASAEAVCRHTCVSARGPLSHNANTRVSFTAGDRELLAVLDNVV